MTSGQFGTTNTGGALFPFIESDNNPGLKQAHDAYDVYVNGDFVGQKVLLTQVDTVDDVGSFLESRDLQGFATELDGDHYNITVENAVLADKIKDHLRVYLRTR